MELLAQLQPGTFQSAWVVSPIGPARGNRQNDWIQEGELPEVLENLGVFVVLDAVPNGLGSASRLNVSELKRLHIRPTARTRVQVSGAVALLGGELAYVTSAPESAA